MALNPTGNLGTGFGWESIDRFINNIPSIHLYIMVLQEPPLGKMRVLKRVDENIFDRFINNAMNPAVFCQKKLRFIYPSNI